MLKHSDSSPILHNYFFLTIQICFWIYFLRILKYIDFEMNPQGNFEGLLVKNIGIPLYWALIGIFGITLFLHSLFYTKYSKLGKQMRLIPGPANYPLIGIIPTFLKYRQNHGDDIIGVLKRVQKEYGDIVGGFLGHEPLVLLFTQKHASV